MTSRLRSALDRLPMPAVLVLAAVALFVAEYAVTAAVVVLTVVGILCLCGWHAFPVR